MTAAKLVAQTRLREKEVNRGRSTVEVEVPVWYGVEVDDEARMVKRSARKRRMVEVVGVEG